MRRGRDYSMDCVAARLALIFDCVSHSAPCFRVPISRQARQKLPAVFKSRLPFAETTTRTEIQSSPPLMHFHPLLVANTHCFPSVAAATAESKLILKTCHWVRCLLLFPRFQVPFFPPTVRWESTDGNRFNKLFFACKLVSNSNAEYGLIRISSRNNN